MVTQHLYKAIVNGSRPIRQKTLQERQQPWFLEFHGKGITRLLIVVFICCISEGKESCSSTNTTIVHVITQMHSHNQY